MGWKFSGDGEEAARLGEPEPAEAPYSNGGYGKPEQDKKKKKKKRSKDRHGIAAEECEDRIVEATERNGTAEGNSKEERKKKKKKRPVEAGEGGGRVLQNGSELGKKRKYVDGGVAQEYGGVEKREGSEEDEDEDEEEVVEANGVAVSGKNAKDAKYAAFSTFSESGLSAEVLDCCKNFSKPSPIQSHSWPFLLDGRDFVGIAATGSGCLSLYVRLSP